MRLGRGWRGRRPPGSPTRGLGAQPPRPTRAFCCNASGVAAVLGRPALAQTEAGRAGLCPCYVGRIVVVGMMKVPP